MKDIPIYDKTVAYATEHNELEAYRASYKANMDCRAAISEAINSNYKDNSLDTKTALKQLTDAFSLERIAVVTAVSVRHHDTDGRISAENKEWAKSVQFPKDMDNWGVDRNAVFSVEGTHTGLINLFANIVRKELEATKTVPIKKPSLIEKINRPLPKTTYKSDKMKGQEL